MKRLFVCLLLLCSYAAHAVDCSKGAPPPSALTREDILIFSNLTQPVTDLHPHFEGEANVHWADDGRCMTLLNDVTYVDKQGDRWTAWQGMGTDGASIPPAAWSIIGGPYEGPYRKAALVHDAACYLRTRSWQSSARMFYEAMLIAGTTRVKALLMFEAVYMFGPKWSVTRQLPPVPVDKVSATVSQIRIKESVSLDAQVRVTNTAIGSAASGNRNVRVTLLPPNAVTFTASDFETLAKQIQAKEEANPGSVTLEEIESYKPAQATPNQ